MKAVVGVVNKELARCKKIFVDHFNVIAPNPEVTYDLKGRTHGRAWGSYKIQVNLAIAERLGEKYANTVGHEYAHIVTNWLRHNLPNNKILDWDWAGGHGRGWKNVMRLFELAPERCASHDDHQEAAVSGAYGVSYHYKCTCHDFYVSQRMHNTILRGSSRRCNKCKAALKFVCKVA